MLSRCWRAALYYAEHYGWRTFPLAPGSKKPFIQGGGGFKAATNDRNQLLEWAGQYPGANIGLATGPGSGVFVVDVDSQKGGDESLAQLIQRHGPLPQSAEQATANGGRHILFRWRPEFHDVVQRELAPKIDLRVAGGYIVIAPSVLTGGREYRWDPGPWKQPVTEAPEWLVGILPRREFRTIPRNDAEREARDARRKSDAFDRARRYVATMPPAISGSGGHTTTPSSRARPRPRVPARRRRRDGVARRVQRQMPTPLANARAPTQAREREGLDTSHARLAARRGTEGCLTEPIPIEKGRRVRVFARGDHVELAHHLRSELSQHGQVVHVDGTTYQYREPVFAPLDLSVPSRIVQSFAGASVDGSKSPLKLRATDIGGAIKLCQDAVTDPEFFEAAPRGVAFSDCFVEVHPERVVQREHSPDNRARFAYPFPFVTDPRPLELLAFFAGVFRDDPDASDKVKCLQEFVGGSMLGLATRYQRAIVNVGQGANGKSVAASVIEQAMPPGSVSAIPPQDFGGEYRRALIAGKLINIVAELPEAEILDSEAFKAVIAGDSTTGRHIRQSPFIFKPTAGHLFAANRLPGTADQTHGFWRRFIVIEFNRIFAEHEQDPQLADRIVATELPDVVSWFLAGAQRLLAQGRYTLPQSSQAAVTDWKRQADQVLAFVEECTAKLPLDAAPHEGERGGELYRAYRGWATVNGHRPLASNKFGVRMKLLGLGAQRTNTGAHYPVTLTRDGGVFDPGTARPAEHGAAPRPRGRCDHRGAGESRAHRGARPAHPGRPGPPAPDLDSDRVHPPPGGPPHGLAARLTALRPHRGAHVAPLADQ